MKEKTKRHWVLIRGIAHERAHWKGFSELLEKAYPGDRISYVDLLGCGIHHKETAPINLKEYVEPARRDIIKVGRPPYTFISLSMGAMVTYAWEQRYPQEVKEMVLMNTSFRNLCPFYERLQAKVWQPFLKAFLSESRVIREKRILEIISTAEYDRDQVAKERAEIQSLRPVKDANILRQLIASAKFSAKFPPKAKTLIISSLGDKLCDPKCSNVIAKAWNMPHSVHPFAGHDLTLDDSEWVLAEINKWFSTIN